ncbi:polysaccharide deacetylase family protein [uncultured Desulfosarcina sp.]|uniref:polysaccharide deacetylase family protein n=1 Tax=uncultured Desulfosarcina sp. TaxID=218289 RepID=UPI0029C95061|nr:polysaccharide deacetylase family protein [uncultured Desulfosarcina sp.]
MALTGSRSTLLSTGLPLFLIFLAVFSGCAGPNAISTLMRPDVYRSDERVLHRLKPGETPEMLAEKYLKDRRLAWMVEDANPKETFLPDRFVVIPLVIPNRAGITDKGYQTVPILCYHRFAPSCDSPLCMPAGIFEQQVRYLKENGYRVIGPEALADFLDYRKPIPKNAVMISVDDGYRSVYDVAFPILKKYGFTATLFIYIDYVGVSSQAITWDQLRELKREGFYIGSHSIAHSDLAKQKKDEDGKAYLARLKREIFTSKQIIDEKLSQDTIIFSYPFGRRNQTVVSLARQAGYKIAVTVDRGSNPFFTDPFLIKRDQILKRDMDRFASRLKTFNYYPLE